MRKKNRCVKRSISAVLLIFVLLWGQSSAAYATETEELSLEEMGIQLPFLIEEEPVESIMEDNVPQMLGIIPASYNSQSGGIVTAAKNQGSHGTCWAFSAISMLESNAVKNNLLSFDEADLSERHLAYYTYYPVTDVLGGTEGDQTVYYPNDMSFLYLGGNINLACRRLANWQGAVLEAAAPYEEAEERLPADIASAYEKDIIHLKNNYIFHKGDTDAIKRAIMEYGSVGISLYVPPFYSSYYNADNYAYYYPFNGSGVNHAVTVIGWDDSFSADNFKENPGADGAWLVKNSWGEGWGDNGCFWISYQDAGIGTNVYAIEADNAGNYDNNYQYDGTILDAIITVGLGEIKISNVFTACAGADKEELKAVSFSPYTVNLEYSIQIFGDLTEENNPESGTPMLDEPVIGYTQTAGYYTVPLDETITLEKGQTFAVVITLSKPGYEIAVYSEDSRRYGSTGMESVASAGEKQSYTCSDGIWSDFGKVQNKNIRIKAFTDNVSGESIPTSAPVLPTPSAAPTASPVNSPVPTAVPVPSGDSSKWPFYDVSVIKGNWKYESVKYVYENNIMSGMIDSGGKLYFAPDEALTRAMFASVLYRMAGSPDVDYVNSFSDVAPGKWYSDAVIWASGEGIVYGFPDGNFRPNANITREQIARMLKLYADAQGIDTSASADLSFFADGMEVSSWALNEIRWAVGTGIMVGETRNGVYYLKPGGEATRAECASLLTQFLQKNG